jgi:hypothetical protein
MLGHARQQLQLGHGKPKGGVGRPGGAPHGPAQAGDDAGQLGPYLLLPEQVCRYVALS